MFTDVFKQQKPQVQKDALRRQTAVRPGAPPTGNSQQYQPPRQAENFLSLLQRQPGMTPALLKTMLDSFRFQKENPPIVDPRQFIAAANYRQPL